MYASLSLKRLATLLIMSFVLTVAILTVVRTIPADPAGWAKLIGLAMRWWLAALFVLFGLHGKLSPWRLLWWCVPPLNRWAFPDLNGKWTGTVDSNWSVIEALLGAATVKTAKIDRDDLPRIPLKPIGIELQIKASLFTFRVEGKLAGVNGTSFSLTERIQKNERRDRFELFYLYLQNTPEPQATDEDSHAGAARLDVDTDAWTLTGEYWTRRSWRSGLNTAGLLSVTRADRGGFF